MHPLETYLAEMHEIKSTGGGVEEESYYSCLEKLLNEIGKKLKPKVRCVFQLKNKGAGEPDGGLYTANQFQDTSKPEELLDQLPERGVIEVKSLKDNSFLTAEGKQVTQYWGKYGQVLVTNYRNFVLVGENDEGKQVKLESFCLAENESSFWAACTHPRKLAEEQGEGLYDYLTRVMLHSVPLNKPEDVAWFLASYAREAKRRMELKKDLSSLEAIRKGLEEALGLKFEGEDGEHFFRATLIQTLFYGVFSSWVLWASESKPKTRFNWHEAAWNLHVPMIASLFDQIATPKQLKPLGLDEVIDWASTVLNRVNRAKFFEAFKEEHAVQYFYEPFLKAYDPELRKELGVWYTPPEIVKYQVERVDRVLREELEIEDGLADPKVYVLDPCCGTGAYLVEVLRKIHETLKDKGNDALIAQRLKKAAMERVFGFELLPAPFVVSHLQLGLLLKNHGAPLTDEKNERVAVFLTNALTGWEPPKKPKDKLLFPELEHEREAAEKVKRQVPILVILGNPPYNAFAGTSPEEEQGLVESYKEGLNKPVKDGGWGIKKFNLDDLYVRFFRIAERRIVTGGKGIVCFISNFSYLGDPSFVVMRQHFLQEFDSLWFDCLNGDSRETGKLTPEGKPDPSVFSTEHNKEGIRVGTAIGLMVRKEKRAKKPVVRFRQFWGVDKREDICRSLSAKAFDKHYETTKPDKRNRYSFRSSSVASSYYDWPSVVDLCAVSPSNGLMEKRGGALIDTERERLEERMRAYLNPRLDWHEYKTLGYGLTESQGRFEPQLTRKKILAQEVFDPSRIKRYALRPFETRWCYYTGIRPVWNEPRPSLWAQCWESNRFFMTRPAGVASPEGCPIMFTRLLGDNDFLRGHAYYFPLQLKDGERLKNKDHASLFDILGDEPKENAPVANLSTKAREYLNTLKIKNPDQDAETTDLIWMHSFAIGYSNDYLSENKEGISENWPRIPLPVLKKQLLVSAELGNEVANLLDTEKGVPGITIGRIRDDFKCIGTIARAGGGPLNPDKGDLELTEGWGHPGKDGATMPGRGNIVERPYSPEELAALERGAKAAGLSLDRVLTYLGKDTRDIYLNRVAFWKNIPAGVWEYYIGGYQVIKKWLSYREKDLLGRSLKMEEAEYVTETARRLAGILLLQPKLNENYRRVKENTYSFSLI